MTKLVKNKFMIIMISSLILLVGIGSFLFVRSNNENEDALENFDVNSEGNLEQNGSQENDQQKQENKIYVHVIGEINNPGVIELDKGSRIINAIEKAGGVTELADLTKINLAYVLTDGVRVKIPSIKDKEDEAYVMQNSGNNIITNGPDYSLTRGGGKVNINTATQTELETLSGIGPSLANKIMEYRNKNGKFKKVEELKNVKGIGQSKFESIKDEVVVD